MSYYILKERIPVLESDPIAWDLWMGTADHVVCKIRKGNIRVSTVFLGIDHNFARDESEPILFETMVFGGKHDQLQKRCSTWEQATTQHLDVCHKIFGKHF